jgi:Ala-tRNA(Pro) deacylase
MASSARRREPQPIPAMSQEQSVPAPPDIFVVLARLDIAYVRHDHQPVYTCEQAERAVPNIGDAAHTKNLFLRDKKGRRHWLVVTLCSKAVDLRALAPLVGADNLSLASAERLAQHLQITPGAVTALALIADPQHNVQLVVDADVWQHDALCCHPLVNTSTLVLSRPDLQRFFDFTGHVPQIVKVAARG